MRTACSCPRESEFDKGHAQHLRRKFVLKMLFHATNGPGQGLYSADEGNSYGNSRVREGTLGTVTSYQKTESQRVWL